MMNAFGEANLTAESAVSLLVLAVREGNVEVDQLAGALGNVLGTTASIGASADDALAFVAAYTRFGVAPAKAVTALNTADSFDKANCKRKGNLRIIWPYSWSDKRRHCWPWWTRESSC